MINNYFVRFDEPNSKIEDKQSIIQKLQLMSYTKKIKERTIYRYTFDR
ncbi:hypothetical protein pb186bvf_016236 [Paramecium bursaria]